MSNNMSPNSYDAQYALARLKVEEAFIKIYGEEALREDGRRSRLFLTFAFGYQTSKIALDAAYPKTSTTSIS